jgi:hypothetical protein
MMGVDLQRSIIDYNKQTVVSLSVDARLLEVINCTARVGPEVKLSECYN